MPRNSLPLVLSLMTFAIGGCASVQSVNSTTSSEPGVYRESSADIVDRAPSSMAVRAETQPQTPSERAIFERTQADFHFALAETYALQGDSARAIEEYKLTLVYDPSSPQVRVRLAAEYIKQGLISEALEHTKAAIEIDPRYADARLLLGGLYSALRMYDDALGEYRAVQKYYPDNLEAPLFIGAILAEQKRYTEAAAAFEGLAKNEANQNSHVAWYYLGRVYLEEDRKKNVSKAEEVFKNSLAVKPEYAEAALALGGLYEESHRRERALQLYQAFQEKHGPNVAVAEELSRLYIENKDFDRAFEQLAVIESADPTDLNVKAKMAFILIEKQRYQEAIKRLEEILAIEPSSDRIRFYLGAVFEEIKDYEAAISHFNKVPIGSGYYPEAVIHAAYLYKLLGDHTKAIETVQQGIRIKDDHAPFYALLASLYDETKQYRQAVSMLTEAVAKVPDHPQLYFFLGNMQDRIGDKEGTIRSMKKVLSLDKDHVQALNFLAYTYAELGRDLEEAEKLARRALELQPNDGYILDTLGWVLFKQGRVTEAIRLLEAAYKIQPNESVIAEHLGDAYYHLQMPEKARKLYLRAAENETNATLLEKIRVKISAIDRQVQIVDTEDMGRQPASSESR